MADATLFTAKNTNNVIISGPMKPEHFKVRKLNGTAYVSDLMGSTGETYPDIDQIADNEAGSEVGIIIKPVVRPSDSWDADTILADDTEVVVLILGTKEYEVWMHINGQDTPVAGTEGEKVYSTSTDGSTNDSRDGSGTLNATQGYAAVVGELVKDFTTGNATSAANGTYAKVRV